jgi:hypothetical protein
VPDDAHALRGRLDAVGPGRADAAELGVAARAVRLSVLAYDDVVDRLAGPERDVAVGAVERAEEVELDVLADEQRPVGRDADGDIGVREAVLLRLRGAGQEQRTERRDEERALQLNDTRGASRAAPSVSK